MTLGPSITAKKKKQDKLIQKTIDEPRYRPGQASTNPEMDTYGTVKKMVFIKEELFQEVKNYLY